MKWATPELEGDTQIVHGNCYSNGFHGAGAVESMMPCFQMINVHWKNAADAAAHVGARQQLVDDWAKSHHTKSFNMTKAMFSSKAACSEIPFPIRSKEESEESA